MLGRKNDGMVGVVTLTTLGVRVCGVLARPLFFFNELGVVCVPFWLLCRVRASRSNVGVTLDGNSTLSSSDAAVMQE
jgi:hypothetical protein